MIFETLVTLWGKLYPRMAHLSVAYILSVAAYRPNDDNATEPVSRQRAAYLLDIFGFRRSHNRPADTLEVLSNVLMDGRGLPNNLVAWQTIAIACYACGDWRRTSTGRKTATWSPVTPGETDLSADARAILASYVGVDLGKLDTYKADRIASKQVRRASAVETVKATERIEAAELAVQNAENARLAAEEAKAAMFARMETMFATMQQQQQTINELTQTLQQVIAGQTAQTVKVVKVKSNGHSEQVVPA